MARDVPHFLSLTPEFTYPSHVLSALIPSKIQQEIPGMSLWVADSASTVNASGNGDRVYNRRTPEPHEATLMVGDGRKMQVEYYGDLDVVFCSERRPPAQVTVKNIAILPGLMFDLFSLNNCLLYTSPSPRDATLSRMPSSA